VISCADSFFGPASAEVRIEEARPCCRRRLPAYLPEFSGASSASKGTRRRAHRPGGGYFTNWELSTARATNCCTTWWTSGERPAFQWPASRTRCPWRPTTLPRPGLQPARGHRAALTGTFEVCVALYFANFRGVTIRMKRAELEDVGTGGEETAAGGQKAGSPLPDPHPPSGRPSAGFVILG